MGRKKKPDEERIAVAQRLRQIWDERKKVAKYTQVDASIEMDMSQSSISDYLNARIPLGFEAASKFARFLQCKPSDFDPRFRTIEATIHNVSAFANLAEPSPDYVVRAKVPLLAWNRASQWHDPESRSSDEWVAASTELSPKAFALRLQGDSMLNPYGAPSFFDGMLLIVEPEWAVSRGEFVIAMLENSEEPIFRQLVVEGPGRYLKALNPHYPLINLGKNTQIIGAVREAKALL